MKVEPVLTYRRPKYPRFGEEIHPKNFLSKNKARIAAMIAISGTLTGCVRGKIATPDFISEQEITQVLQYETEGLAFTLGAVAMPDFLSEQEIIQILQYEAEKMGLVFGSKQNPVIKYSDQDIILDLYNEEKRTGVAVINRDQADKLYREDNRDDFMRITESGIAAKGRLKDNQPANFFLTSEYQNEYSKDDLRKAFQEFIEWLQAEGII